MRDAHPPFYLPYLLPSEQTHGLAYPEDGGGAGDDDEPVGHAQRHDVEELAAEADDGYLSHQDDRGYKHEFCATPEVEGRAACGEGSGIEEIPELQEDKDCEEERELVGRQAAVVSHRQAPELSERRKVGMLKVVEQRKENHEEQSAHPADEAPHRGVDDKGRA